MRLYLQTALATLLLFVVTGVLQQTEAQEVQSDYEIVQNFNKNFDDLQKALDTVTTVSSAENLVNRIEKLRNNFSEHKELLNKALYPQTYEEKIQTLSSQARSTHKRLKVIAQQKKKLQQLTGNVNRFESRLTDLQQRTDSLQKVLNEANQRNQNLSSTVRQYRKNVSKRDQLVLSIIDSLVANYQKLDSRKLQELSMAYKQSRKNIDSNALKLVETIARTNLEFLNSTKTLSTADYLRLYSVYQKFRDMWSKIGDELVQIYKPEGTGEAIRNELQSSLNEWETKVTDQTWKSINRAFGEADINLSEFGDSKGFYQSLTSFIEKGIKKGDRKQYKKFTQFWNNTLKSDWAQHLTGTELLSYKQISQIDQKLEKWDTKTAPASYLWKILVAVAVLIIIVLGIMLARAKSGAQEQ